MDRLGLKSWLADWQSLAAPLVLILTGLLLMTGDGLGILSLADIQNLWPVALILIGLSEFVTYQVEEQAGTTSNARR